MTGTSTLQWDGRRTRRLFRKYARTGSESVRNQIFMDYLGLVELMARQYSGRGVDYEDLYQEGCLGLLAAIDRFDLSRGVEFHTYASWPIRGHILQCFRSKAWPCAAPKSVKAMALRVKRLGDELGRRPTEQEMEELCGIPPERIADAVAATAAWEPVSFFQADSSSAINPVVLRAHAAEDPGLAAVEDRVMLESAIEQALDAGEAGLVRMYYYEDMPQREIAQRTGTYQMRVSRILQRCIVKLNRALGGEKLRAS